MKLYRLRGRKNNEQVLKNGNVWKGKTMICRFQSGHPRNLPSVPATQHFYLGTYASAHLDPSAVRRNRMRRRCREAFRLTLKDMAQLPTVQVLMTPKIASLRCDFDDISADVAAFLAVLKRAA